MKKNRLKQKIKLIGSFAIVMLAYANFASAQLVKCGTSTTKPCKISDLILLVTGVINFLLGFAGLVAILFIFIGGIRMTFASASPDQVKAGKDTLTNAIMGFVMVVGAYLIINILVQVLMGEGMDINGLIKFWTT